MELIIHINYFKLTLFFLISYRLIQSLFSSLHSRNSNHQEWKQWVYDFGEAKVTVCGDVSQECSSVLDAG